MEKRKEIKIYRKLEKHSRVFHAGVCVHTATVTRKGMEELKDSFPDCFVFSQRQQIPVHWLRKKDFDKIFI